MTEIPSIFGFHAGDLWRMTTTVHVKDVLEWTGDNYSQRVVEAVEDTVRSVKAVDFKHLYWVDGSRLPWPSGITGASNSFEFNYPKIGLKIRLVRLDNWPAY